jgi:hypothetical protein
MAVLLSTYAAQLGEDVAQISGLSYNESWVIKIIPHHANIENVGNHSPSHIHVPDGTLPLCQRKELLLSKSGKYAYKDVNHIGTLKKLTLQ